MTDLGPLLIAGLGNPGEKYVTTRHNLGFLAIEAFAKKRQWAFKREWRLKGKIASGLFEGKKVLLLKPSTYMNLSGQSIKKSMAYYSVVLQDLLVVVDDVNLQFNTLRIRPNGSSGGHNGLRSVIEDLETTEYSRLRLGVNGVAQPEMSLKDYVLANFDEQEREILPSFLEKAVDILECWICKGITHAMQLAGDLSKVDR